MQAESGDDDSRLHGLTKPHARIREVLIVAKHSLFFLLSCVRVNAINRTGRQKAKSCEVSFQEIEEPLREVLLVTLANLNPPLFYRA